MMYVITGNGSGESLYDKQLIELESTNEEEVQQWADEWRQSLPDDKLDQFGDINPNAVSIEDIVEAMPTKWQPILTDKQGSCLFL